MDILGSLLVTFSGNKYLLVVVDCFTKWVEAFPLKNIRTKTIAEIFLSQVISRHGVLLEVHTDQGRNFESRIFRELSQLLGIKKTRTSALHPQHEATGVTPAEMYFAQDLRLPVDLLRGNPPKFEVGNSTNDYLGKIKRKLEEVHDQVRKRIDIKSSRTKTWVKGKAPKLQSSWESPYCIVKKLSDVVYCVRKSSKHKNKVVHLDRLAPYLERQLV
ncbi:uncharacterized protein [Mycetomoellerius zeteki]|uniref:uncharacterized protein n=1 Tax=Mycetomoellerius zeteki TaxID=64791 RepID=UPI00084EB8C6|nr:PREDICTED: uncharacterized protein LOC108728851 [Trachymyrmex zeteki]